MIIYGYRNKEIEQGTGVFQCPTCGDQRTYIRKEIVRYFTLFFIPLFPLGTLSEYVECQVCRRTYQPGIPALHGQSGTEAAGQAAYYSEISNRPADSGAPTQRNSCLPLALLFGGVLVSILGFGITFLMIVAQIDQPIRWQGFFATIAICPVPLIVGGVRLFLFGLNLRQKAAVTK